MCPELIIKKTRQKDLKYILFIEKDNFEIPWSEAQFLKELQLDISSCYSLFSHNQLIGYAVIWNVNSEYELLKIAIEKNMHHSGIGSFFLSELIEIAKTNNIKRMTLEVRSNNSAAIHLYKKYNFHIDGIRPEYYAPDNQDAVLMSLTL